MTHNHLYYVDHSRFCHIRKVNTHTQAADYCTCVMQSFIGLTGEFPPLLGYGGGFPDISPDCVKENYPEH